MQHRADAVIVGGGVNGLVAANDLADAGWDVVLIEDQPDVGGAVRSRTMTPGVVTDLFSAFYPLAAASPAILRLDLAAHGLSWRHAPTVLAHPDQPAGSGAALLHHDPEQTAAGLEADHPGDGEAWLTLVRQWHQVKTPLLGALFTPFPPVRSAAALARVVGLAGLPEFARFLVLPAAVMAQETFGGERGRALLLGNAAHADLPVTAAGSGLFAWMLAMLGQDVGFPVPHGGAGRLTEAMAARATAAGVQITRGTAVTEVVVRGGRALGVRCSDGTTVRAKRAVLGAVDLRILMGDLIHPHHVPAGYAAALQRFQTDPPVVKVNWALPAPPNWRVLELADAGTLHLGADSVGVARWSSDLETEVVSRRPFMLVGQMAVADASRASNGRESLWAYTHLPRSMTVARVGIDAVRDGVASVVEGVERQLREHAPGFDEGAERFVQGPEQLVADNASLVQGAMNGGTCQVHQQLLFRPVPGTGRPALPIRGLYLASSSAHPGGGVHGACGHNAALVALRDNGGAGPFRTSVEQRLLKRLYG